MPISRLSAAIWFPTTREQQVVEFCVVDDFYFFPYLAETQPPHEFYAEVLAVLQPEATRCKCAVEVRRFSLRAPPAA